MKVWVKVGNSNPTKITVDDNADIDDLKKAIKKELEPGFNATMVSNILIKHPQTNVVIDPSTPLAQFMALGIGGSTIPFLVDAPQSETIIERLRALELDVSRRSLAVPVPTNVQGCVYYLMKATIKNSKHRNGWRSGVYAMCAKALGYYNLDKTQSIYYEGDDLHINILFSSVDNCHAFLKALHETRNQYYTSAEIDYEGTPQSICLPSHPPAILASHYVTDDFDSPPFTDQVSFDDSASVCSLSNPTAHLLMLENPARFVGLEVYDCHLMSVHRYPGEKYNQNNILRLSWQLHQYFDRLHTQGKHMFPLIAIGFVCAAKKEQIEVSHGYTELKYRVTVFIEAKDRRVLDVVRIMLKAGSESNPDKDGKLYSFVHVDSDTDFERCLTVKYEETKALWRHEDGTEILPDDFFKKRGRR